jgi:hypothetical protein
MSNNNVTATAVGVAAIDATAVDGDDDAAMISIQQHKKKHRKAMSMIRQPVHLTERYTLEKRNQYVTT